MLLWVGSESCELNRCRKLPNYQLTLGFKWGFTLARHLVLFSCRNYFLNEVNTIIIGVEHFTKHIKINTEKEIFYGCCVFSSVKTQSKESNLYDKTWIYTRTH